MLLCQCLIYSPFYADLGSMTCCYSLPMHLSLFAAKLSNFPSISFPLLGQSDQPFPFRPQCTHNYYCFTISRSLFSRDELIFLSPTPQWATMSCTLNFPWLPIMIHKHTHPGTSVELLLQLQNLARIRLLPDAHMFNIQPFSICRRCRCNSPRVTFAWQPYNKPHPSRVQLGHLL
jgi:hypothetical protein